VSATAKTMANYVTAMANDVLGCYEVNPRRTLWQRQHDIYPNNRKTFMIRHPIGTAACRQRTCYKISCKHAMYRPIMSPL
jgi:hypothetical protein